MNILIGITGSISAYKTLDVISMLRKEGHDVKCIMTESAKMFVTEMAVATLSNNVVISSFEADMNGRVEHVELAKWANIMVIAPATQNTISKMAIGMTDNVLLCAWSAFIGWGHRRPSSSIIAPAMNSNMYSTMTRDRLNRPLASLVTYGCTVVDPVSGKLACGDVGIGKLAKPETIVKYINDVIEDIYE